MRLRTLVQIEEVFKIHTKNSLLEVTKDNYFENTGHLSVSKFKRFLRCEKNGLSEYGNPTSLALLVGSYVDAYVEGTLDEFVDKHPEIISSRGKTKGELKSDFKQADEICDFIDNDSNLQDFLGGEKQKIMVGEINGIPYKIMMDSYDEGIAISDLKIMKSITNRDGSYYDFIEQWGYNFQASIYQEIVRQNTGIQLPFFICALTKEYPINSAIIQVDQDTMDRALDIVKENSPRFYDLMNNLAFANGCGKCGTCISSRKVTPIISMETLRGGV